jgi:hypothetical protein
MFCKFKFFPDMATFAKTKLSGSTNGKQILVTVTTNGTAQTIHTAVASTGTNTWDEVWLYAYNDNATVVVLTLLWGGTNEPDNVLRVSLAGQSGRLLVCDGMILQNSLIIKAYASVASKVTIDGFVNSIT